MGSHVLWVLWIQPHQRTWHAYLHVSGWLGWLQRFLLRLPAKRPDLLRSTYCVPDDWRLARGGDQCRGEHSSVTSPGRRSRITSPVARRLNTASGWAWRILPWRAHIISPRLRPRRHTLAGVKASPTIATTMRIAWPCTPATECGSTATANREKPTFARWPHLLQQLLPLESRKIKQQQQ